MFSCADISKPTWPVVGKPEAPAEPKQERSQPLKVTGRLKTALEIMAWQGLRIIDAAAKAEIHVNTLYSALKKPHVLAHYNALLQVLRTGERARNIHRLAEIRDAADNMPAVQAIGMLERMSEESATQSSRSAATPGVVIHIITRADSAQERDITPKPLITQDGCAVGANADDAAFPNQGSAKP